MFFFLLFHKRHNNKKKNNVQKSQVRAGRLLLWQKNHFNIQINWSDCGGTALVAVSRSFLVVLSISGREYL